MANGSVATSVFVSQMHRRPGCSTVVGDVFRTYIRASADKITTRQLHREATKMTKTKGTKTRGHAPYTKSCALQPS